MSPPADNAKPNTQPQRPAGGGDHLVFTVALTLMGLAAAAVPFLVGNRPGGNEVFKDGAAPATPRQLCDFTLTNSAGHPVNRADLTNKVLVVSFMSSSCSQWCLEVNQRVREAQRELADAEDVQFLSFTIDPRSDPPPALAQYAAKLNADTNRWSFLTGDKTSVYQVIERSFLSRGPDAGPGEPYGGFDDVSHVVLVDRHGKVRRYFNGLSPTVATRITTEARKLCAESRQP